MSAALAGQVAVVTGASRGIGLAVADALAAQGAHVVRLARSLKGGSGERRTELACDVTDPASVSRAAKEVLARHGAPDVLVQAAGTFLLKPLVETSPEEFTSQLSTNLAGPFAVLRAFLGAMVARGKGLVVTIGSVADHEGLPGNAAYGAAKHGLRGLHGALEAELKGSGVRAALISPGAVDTGLWDDVDPDRREGFTKRRDMLKAEDVAEAVVWVATRPARVRVPELFIEPAR